MRYAAIAAALVALSSLAVTTAVGSDSSSAALEPATIDIWVSGNFAGATPGTPYRKWLDNQTARFKKANPGSDVKYTLLSTDNEQVAAKLQAAFTAKQTPDILLLYAGGYTTPYASHLKALNPYFKATPGLFGKLSGMNLSCLKFDCKGGSGTIIGVPQDLGSFGLFYNKEIFAKAGVKAPLKTWNDLLAACDKLKAAGTVPITFGDRDGYSTTNWVTYMYGSTFAPGDVAKVDAGTLKYSSPKLVAPLEKLVQLRKRGCVNKDASTRENFDANSDFLAKKSAMVLMYTAVVPDFVKALGSNLGVMRIPIAGNGPLAGKPVANPFYNWTITKDAKHPDLAWSYIKVASSVAAGGELITVLGTPPAVHGVSPSLAKDDATKFFLKLTQAGAMPLLDSVIPVPVALFYYKQLSLAVSGRISALDAMKAVDRERPKLMGK
jgi:ABC-type glycerol-3-phosphate transport system substrate-binding protein